MSFKQFFKEAKEPSYSTVIAGRAKFQIGDVVAVRETVGGGLGYARYHSKKLLPYLDQIGEVVGWQSGSQYTKYAIKMNDGNVILVHSHFVFGPFKDKATAQKYAGKPKKAIDPNDYKTSVGKDVPLASMPKIETYMKSFLAPLGFTWLSTPKVITKGKVITTVLATKPITHDIQKTYDEPLIKGYFCCYKQNNAITKKLKTTGIDKLSTIAQRGFRTYDREHEQYDEYSSGVCSYFLEGPKPFEEKYKITMSYKEVFFFKKFGVNTELNSIEQNKDTIYSIFDAFEHIHTNPTVDDYSVVSRLYKITEENGVKTIHGSIVYDALHLTDPYFFKDFNLTGSFVITGRDKYVDNAPPRTHLKDFSFMPRSVRNIDLDLSAFSTIVSTKGMPKIQKGFDIKYGNIAKFEDMPEVINGNFNIWSSDKLTSLAGCPNTINGNFNISTTPLKTLVGGPEVVTGDYKCMNTDIKNFIGAPKIVGEKYKEEIEDKLSKQEYIGSSFGFYGNDNKNLVSCEGAPEVVYGDFSVNSNKNLVSLQGSPKKIIGGTYNLGDCPKLKNLEGLTLDIEYLENRYKYKLGYKDTNLTDEDIERYVKVAKVKQGLTGNAAETWEDILG
jgi:hypothetical protein